MPTTYSPYQPVQRLLLPPDLHEWVPPGHLAHHVSDAVVALDLTAFYAPYEGDGLHNVPYEASLMVKVLIYAYATGTFSSRAVASSDADIWGTSANCMWGWSGWRARWDWRGSG